MSESYVIGGVVSKQPKLRSVNSVAPLVGGDHVFEIPAKLIKTTADMKIWEKSEAYFEYLGFILAINEAIKGKSNTKGSENSSESVKKMVKMLDQLDAKIDETPPIQQPQRFGNVAFRTWFQKMKDDSLGLLQAVMPPELYKAIPEVVSYLVDSFGNPTRIDYGTGHEISFVMFMCCLFKIGLLKDADKVASGCSIFPRYLDLARKLQKTYRMEPAGSHGVWSLDDYQFVPFIWGSSQLFAHPQIEPAGFLQPQLLNHFGDDYMFLTCINYINSVKTGPFAEHSNQLWSISGVSSWTKINGGLIKMYKAEVLSKFPVVQHIVFGSLFTLKPMEQCTGLMTAKTSLVLPPKPFPKDTDSQGSSTGESEQSQESSAEGSGPSSYKESLSETSAPDSKESGRASLPSEKASDYETSLRSAESDVRESRPSVQSKKSTQSDVPSARASIREPVEEMKPPSKTSRQSKGSQDMRASMQEQEEATVRYSQVEEEIGRISYSEEAEQRKSIPSERTVGLRTSAHLGIRQPREK